MTKEKYIKTKEYIDWFLQKIKAEAIEKGEDISNFDNASKKLITKLLGFFNVSPNEYFSIEEEIAEEKAQREREVDRLIKGEIVDDLHQHDKMGPEGPQGLTGPQGEKGDDGKDGENGKDGIDGKDGKDGIDGLPGIDGEQGPEGPEGTGIEFQWDETKLGIKRDDQDIFIYTDLKGEKGETGEHGWRGPSGPKGDKGDAGPSEWGQIDGTLSDQTDLQLELDAKLTIDQTTPQTIINGVPLFEEARTIDHIHQLVDKLYVDVAVTSLGARFYMLSTLSGVTQPVTSEEYYLTSLTASAGAETSVTATDPSDNDFIAGWISPVGEAPTRLIKGVYEWDIFAAKTGAGNKTFRVYWTLVERKSDDSEVVIGTSAESNLLGAKAKLEVPLTLSEDYIPDAGSRIVGKIYTRLVSGVSAANIVLYSEGDSDSHWEIPTNLEILNGTFVPYTGANANVDLGTYNLTTTGDITAGNLDIAGWNAKADYNFLANNFSGTGNFTTSGEIYGTDVEGSSLELTLSDAGTTAVNGDYVFGTHSFSGTYVVLTDVYLKGSVHVSNDVIILPESTYYYDDEGGYKDVYTSASLDSSYVYVGRLNYPGTFTKYYRMLYTEFMAGTGTWSIDGGTSPAPTQATTLSEQVTPFKLDSSGIITQLDLTVGNKTVGKGTLTTDVLKVSEITGLDGSIYMNPTAIPSGAGSRLVWLPTPRAFRAGGVTGTEWDAANIGQYSFAVGYNTRATVDGSNAFGFYTLASGDYASAFGYFTEATGSMSVGFGFRNKAQGSGSTALGAYNVISGTYAFGAGDDNTISSTGYASTALGKENNISTFYGFTAGIQNVLKTNADFAFASGSVNEIEGTAGVALGVRNYLDVWGQYALAVGYYNAALAQSAFSGGYNQNEDRTSQVASGIASFVFGTAQKGTVTTASVDATSGGWTVGQIATTDQPGGVSAIRRGFTFEVTTIDGTGAITGFTILDGGCGFASGTFVECYAGGQFAEFEITGVAAGTLKATGYGSSAIGVDNNTTGDYSSTFGRGVTNSDNNSFAVGYGKITFQVLEDLIILHDIPTADPGVSGALWSDSGTIKIST